MLASAIFPSLFDRHLSVLNSTWSRPDSSNVIFSNSSLLYVEVNNYQS